MFSALSMRSMSCKEEKQAEAENKESKELNQVT
jgi:hypothetical protein